MRELPLNALRAFAVVYSSGGVRAAARELGVAHSAVSRHLAELERWLGVTLVRPGTGRRGLGFTPQGETLGKAAVASLEGIAQVVGAIREVRSEWSITIATSPSVAVRWLLPRLAALGAAHPKIDASVIVDQRLHDLATGNIDLAIRIGDGRWADVRSLPLMDDALYPVMSPALFASSGRPRRPADLRRLRLLHDRDPAATWEAWRRVHGPPTLDVRRGPRLASSDLVLRAAVQGLGVALARHRLAHDDVASGALVRPLGELRVELGTTYWLVLPTHMQPRRVTSLVVDWLQQHP